MSKGGKEGDQFQGWKGGPVTKGGKEVEKRVRKGGKEETEEGWERGGGGWKEA